MNITLKKFPYKYLPYEERLLLQEAQAIGDFTASQGFVELNAKLSGDTAGSLIAKLHRLTYFSHFRLGDGPLLPTQQFLLETTANGGATATRQSTRYSTHGLHEYKGKFHPQIARYLMTQSNLTANSIVFDPFAGSGTVLVEAIHFGCNAIGVEANPLAVLVANSKTKLLTCTDREIRAFQKIAGNVISGLAFEEERDVSSLASKLGIGETAFAYLRSWFAPQILANLLRFRANCRGLLTSEWSDVADVLASSIARDVSQQDPADLRIRRRKAPLIDAPVADLLASNLRVLITRAIGARNLICHSPALAREFSGDSRRLPREFSDALRAVGSSEVSCIITSPPYATALPYVDTSRLSLVLLGLCGVRELKCLERMQIGNREISPAERERLESDIEAKLKELPRQIEVFVKKLLSSVRTSDAGFRKRNTPALLVEYFSDMKEVLVETRRVLAQGGAAYWLVGPNKTQANDKWLNINTPYWIAAIAESVGYTAQVTALDAYQRFGLHQRNGIRQEFLLSLLRD